MIRTTPAPPPNFEGGALSRRHIFVVESDLRCVNLLRTVEPEAVVHAVADLEQWEIGLKKHYGAIGLLEVLRHGHGAKTTDFLIQIQNLTRECRDSLLFAVGKPDLGLLYRILFMAGFGQIYTSMADGPRMEQACLNHWKSINWPQQDLTESIDSSLPWSRPHGE